MYRYVIYRGLTYKTLVGITYPLIIRALNKKVTYDKKKKNHNIEHFLSEYRLNKIIFQIILYKCQYKIYNNIL